MKEQNLALVRKITGVIAGVLMAAVLMTGTFALEGYAAQHQEAPPYSVRLAEDAVQDAAVQNWRVAGGMQPKSIRVLNNGTAGDDTPYEAVYVRVMLKEYLEHAGTFAKTNKRYMVNPTGNFIVFSSLEDAQAAYPGHSYGYMQDAVGGRQGYFVQSKEGGKNGQYGRYVTYVAEGSYKPEPLIAGVKKADATKPGVFSNGHNMAECSYTPVTWGSTPSAETALFNQWRTLHQDSSDTLFLSEWDGQPDTRWILDDVNGTGWAYWGVPLIPGGATASLLTGVSLLQDNDSLYYALHTELEAVSQEELAAKWPDAPPEVIAALQAAQ